MADKAAESIISSFDEMFGAFLLDCPLNNATKTLRFMRSALREGPGGRSILNNGLSSQLIWNSRQGTRRAGAPRPRKGQNPVRDGKRS